MSEVKIGSLANKAIHYQELINEAKLLLKFVLHGWCPCLVEIPDEASRKCFDPVQSIVAPASGKKRASLLDGAELGGRSLER